jgi:CPA1 family monovalent cation:H+ antiporter
VFAALVSATDPIAVVSLFRKLGVAQRLTTLVEAESLFNDGTSIVALTLILAFVSGESTGVVSLTTRFLLVVIGGGAVGGVIAYAIVRVTKRINDPMIEITLTTIAAYGSFVGAESLHLSGVIATVVAGLVLGLPVANRRSRLTRARRLTRWQYIAFALNSIVFLLIGFEVRPVGLLSSSAVIGVAFIIVVAASAALMRGTDERIPAEWTVLITWGGLRGALAMVLALAPPPDLPQRRLLIDMTFGVVVISLLLQGLTIPWLTSRLAPASPVQAAASQSV